MAAFQSDGVDLLTGRPPTTSTGTKHAPSASGMMRGFGATHGVGSTDAILTATTAVAPAGQTTLAVYMCASAGGGGLGRVFQKGNGTWYCHVLGCGGAGLWMARYVTAGAISQNVSIPRGTDGVPHVAVFTSDGQVGGAPPASGVAGYIDGVPQTLSVGSTSGVSGGDNAAYYLGNRNDGTRSWDGWIGAVFIWNRVLLPAEIRALSINPWQLFESEDVYIWVPTSSGAALLAGAAQASAAASGALTAQIKLDGAALAQAVAAGGLLTGIMLAGAAGGQATAGGALTTQITLTGAALDVVTAGGTLTTQISLAGAALDVVTAGGSVTAQIKIAGDALAQVTAGGTLNAVFSLAGDALGAATASGTLTAQIKLSAAAAAQAVATGSLTVDIPLSGPALAQATAGGQILTGIRLAGAAQAAAQASGALDGSQAAGPLILAGSVKCTATLSSAARRAGALATTARLAATLHGSIAHV